MLGSESGTVRFVVAEGEPDDFDEDERDEDGGPIGSSAVESEEPKHRTDQSSARLPEFNMRTILENRWRIARGGTTKSSSRRPAPAEHIISLYAHTFLMCNSPTLATIS